MMAHVLKPDLVFQRNERFHLNRRECQFSRLLAEESGDQRTAIVLSLASLSQLENVATRQDEEGKKEWWA